MSYTQGTWDTGDQIRTHRLATSIINLHGTPDEVFDSDCLSELRDFTVDRSKSKRDAWLAERGFNAAEDDEQEKAKPGSKAAGRGSLTGYLVARYGTDDEALDERDWELLEEWFGKGMPVGQRVSR